jgi:two-component system response regulator
MPDKVILLIEDNRSDQKQMIRALRSTITALEIVSVEDGEEALDYLFGAGLYSAPDTHVLPDFILLDLNLPVIGGIDVLKQIRAHDVTRVIPVIIFTSSKEETDLAQCYDLGANSYVWKPIDADEFTATVQQTGSYWLNVNQQPPLLGQGI